MPSRSSRNTTRRCVDRGRVVEVDDRALRAVDRLETALDEIRPRLRQHGDRRAARDGLLLDEGGGRSRNPSSMPRGSQPRSRGMPSSSKELEESPLARAVHRVDERLVAIAKVGRAPDRGRVEDAVGPRSIGQIDGRVRSVFPVRHRHRVLLGSENERTRGAAKNGYVGACFPYRGRRSARATSDRRARRDARLELITEITITDPSRVPPARVRGTGCRRRPNRLFSPARVERRNSRNRSRWPQGRDFWLRPHRLVGAHPPAPPH